MLQRCLIGGTCFVLILAAVLDGVDVPKRFELRIPGGESAAFTGNEILLTEESVGQLVIDILNPTAKEIETSKIYPKINGEAASTISELRRTRRGYALILDLEMKPHLKLDPDVNTVEIVAENHRGRRFYQNWIVRLHDRSHHNSFNVERINGPGQSNSAPPDIEVLSPAVPPVVESGRKQVGLAVQANITAYHPLASVDVDGVTDSLAAGKDQVYFDRRLTIPSSQSEVVLRAADIRGNETRVRIPIRRAKAAPPPMLSGKRYLLSIGISNFQSTAAGLPDLPGASTAAGDLGRFLVERVGLSQDTMLVLRDRDATLARVRSALRDFAALPGPDDLLIIYISTYGFHGFGPEADQTYLGFSDTRLDQLRETALSLEGLAILLEDTEQIRSRNVVLLFEPYPLPELEQIHESSNLVNAHLMRLFSTEMGRTVLVSADVNQESQSKQTKDGLQGVFARALMQGLQGDADQNLDRILTVPELFSFVSERATGDSGGAQVPKYRIVDPPRVLVPIPAPVSSVRDLRQAPEAVHLAPLTGTLTKPE